MIRAKSVYAKTRVILNVIQELLSDETMWPWTVRQLFYQLVVRVVIENTKQRYNAIMRIVSDARQRGEVPWDAIEDRTRHPRTVAMWDGLSNFLEDVRRSYRRNVWATQPRIIEAITEKDALSAIMMDVLEPFGVTLNVIRGYNSRSGAHAMMKRYQRWDGGRNVTLIYFGDHDPSGIHIPRNVLAQLNELGSHPTLIRAGLNKDQIKSYGLLENPFKEKDPRAADYKREFGTKSWELDALPPDVLRQTLRNHVERLMDLDALDKVRKQESGDKARLVRLLSGAAR